MAYTTCEHTGSRSVRALICLYTRFGGEIEIRDPTRRHPRIGPSSTLHDDELDSYVLDLGDIKLIPLESGRMYTTKVHLKRCAEVGWHPE